MPASSSEAIAAPVTSSAGATRVRVHRDAPRLRNTYPGWAVALGAAVAAAGIYPVWMYGTGRGGPYALAALFVGASFILMGGYLVVLALRSVLYRTRANAQKRRGRAPWWHEHPWHRSVATAGVRARAVHALTVNAIAIFFLVPFHLLAASESGLDWIVIAVLALFDLAIGASAAYALYLLWRYFKFGESRVLFSGFPLHTGDTVKLTFEGGPLLRNCAGLEAELVCLEEFYEQKGDNMDHVHERLYHDVQTFATGAAGTALLEFHLPPDAPATRLAPDADERPRYWELVVKAERPGVDYEGIFLLPIYARA